MLGPHLFLFSINDFVKFHSFRIFLFVQGAMNKQRMARVGLASATHGRELILVFERTGILLYFRYKVKKLFRNLNRLPVESVDFIRGYHGKVLNRRCIFSNFSVCGIKKCNKSGLDELLKRLTLLGKESHWEMQLCPNWIKLTWATSSNEKKVTAYAGV